MAEDTRRRNLSFSSEYKVKRWFGVEILDHGPKSVRMGFMASGRAPLLIGHDQRMVIGVIESARIDTKEKRGRSVVRFGRGDQASDALRDVDDAILTNVSTGYRVHEMVLEKQSDAGDTYRITDWEPMEASLLGIPADPDVGVGRGADVDFQELELSTSTAVPAEKERQMRNSANAAAGASAEDLETGGEGAGAGVETRGAELRIEAGRQQAEGNFAAENEKRRKQAIRNLGKVNGIGDDTVETWIQRGSTLDQVADDMLKIFEERGASRPQSISVLDLSVRDTNQYSLCRAILAAHTGDWKRAGFELECHNTIQNRTDKPQEKGHFYVPMEVQRRQTQFNPMELAQKHNLSPLQLRDLTAGIAGAGGFLVQTSIASYDELLRNIAFAFRMGATRISGLRDNITIPRQSASATAEWLTDEADSPAESAQAFVQLAMSPKTVGAYTELSRKLLLQASIDVEGLVNADLAAATALAVDVATIRGSGTVGQPMGLDNVTGVGTVSGGSLGLAGLLETQTDLATSNVKPLRGGYVTTPGVAALMIAEVLYASTASPAWVGNVWEGTMLGFPAMSTNQVASGTMYFGDWSKLVVGEWGVLEIDTNPHANFPAGIIGVRALYSVDVGVRLPAAFTIVSSIT
jgi:HK97 family phage major capsid protein